VQRPAHNTATGETRRAKALVTRCRAPSFFRHSTSFQLGRVIGRERMRRDFISFRVIAALIGLMTFPSQSRFYGRGSTAGTGNRWGGGPNLFPPVHPHIPLVFCRIGRLPCSEGEWRSSLGYQGMTAHRECGLPLHRISTSIQKIVLHCK
jgi:hypothetical protein